MTSGGTHDGFVGLRPMSGFARFNARRAFCFSDAEARLLEVATALSPWWLVAIGSQCRTNRQPRLMVTPSARGALHNGGDGGGIQA